MAVTDIGMLTSPSLVSKSQFPQAPSLTFYMIPMNTVFSTKDNHLVNGGLNVVNNIYGQDEEFRAAFTPDSKSVSFLHSNKGFLSLGYLK
jgi:hypothetical protein